MVLYNQVRFLTPTLSGFENQPDSVGVKWWSDFYDPILGWLFETSQSLWFPVSVYRSHHLPSSNSAKLSLSEKTAKIKFLHLHVHEKLKKNRLRVSFSRMSVRQIIRRYRLKSFVDGNTGTGSILPGLDLRSDTITMPSQEIRQIMASAKVKNLKIQNEVNLTGRSLVKCSNGFLHFKAKFSLWRFTFFRPVSGLFRPDYFRFSLRMRGKLDYK